MILKPTIKDLKVIAYYASILVVSIGFLMLIPIATGLFTGEYERSIDFIIAMSLTLIFGFTFMGLTERATDLTWSQGLIVVAVAWLLAMFFSAIPLFLSGHYIHFIDAMFDTMSGFSTTGLSLIQNVDHASDAINMWRHLTPFIGGQGIAVVGLTFLIRLPGAGGAFEMYAGEGREERVLPHVSKTSRFIWKISLIYLVLGTLALFSVMMIEGMPYDRSILHGIWIFMAAWDTAGFTPQSQSILYYHSAFIEMVTMIFMLGGGMSFGLHYLLWNNKTSEIRKNIETVTLFISILVLTAITYIGFAQNNLNDQSILYRKGFYHLLSAHTTTGYSTVYSSELLANWSPLAFMTLIIAMAMGASASSTSGGIKMLRIRLTLKYIKKEIKKISLPESAIVIEKYHLLKNLILQDQMIRAVLIIFLLYIASYVTGMLALVYYGYPLDQAMFESISAAANVGLSSGVTSTSMPVTIKIIFIVQMWIGRLEFMSVFALIGLMVARIKGK